MSYLGRRGAVAPLTSGDIPDGVIEGRDIAFFENGSGQDLSGTYSTERMYLAGRTGSAPNDYNYKLVGNIDVTGHLALGTIADDDVIITQDSTERTITGSGTLESGRLANDPTTSLTGMTGELGSAVNLNSTTFPAGHIIQTVTAEDIDGTSGTPNAYSNTTSPIWLDVVSVSITPSSGTKCICFVDAIIGSAGTGSSSYCWVRVLRDSTTLGLSSLSSYDWPSISAPPDTATVHQYARSAYDIHGANGSESITYKLQISNQHASYAIYAGRGHTAQTNTYGSAQSSRIIVMEVK